MAAVARKRFVYALLWTCCWHKYNRHTGVCALGMRAIVIITPQWIHAGSTGPKKYTTITVIGENMISCDPLDSTSELNNIQIVLVNWILTILALESALSKSDQILLTE